MIRRVLFILLAIIGILVILYFPLISYGVKQGLGQLKIVWNSKPLEEVKADPAVPDSIKASLDFVREVVEFGVQEIGLEDEGNYQTYFDQQGNPVLFVVMGAEKFALEPYEWEFPVIGRVPYKGFFDEEDAIKEWQKLKTLNYDAGIRNPGGWSTLGWFKDPVLSEMLSKSRGNLANTILHELTHATIFVKDSIEYNENLATFIGNKATLLFLEKKYGKGSLEWQQYLNEKEDFNKYVRHILAGAAKLDSLYKNMSGMKHEEKLTIKEKTIQKIVNLTDTIQFTYPEKFQWKQQSLPNNTYFMSFLRYRARQGDFDKILEKDHNNNLKSFVKHLQVKYSAL